MIVLDYWTVIVVTLAFFAIGFLGYIIGELHGYRRGRETARLIEEWSRPLDSKADMADMAHEFAELLAPRQVRPSDPRKK